MDVVGGAGRLVISLAISFAVAGVVLVASPAWAHEFPLTLATALDADTTSAVAADRLAGFRLAVDRSPDVSHPAGEEGGDHLGGIDVAIDVVDLGAPGAPGAPVEPGTHRGVAVVIGSPGALTSWAAGTRDFDLVIAVQTAPGPAIVLSAPSITLGPLGDEAPATPAYLSFARAYAEAYGVPPTVDVGLGYDAGQMVDAVIAAMGTATSDASVLAATSVAAAEGLTASRVVLSDAMDQQGELLRSYSSSDTDSCCLRTKDTSPMSPNLVLFILLGLVMAAGISRLFALDRRAARSSTPADEPESAPSPRLQEPGEPHGPGGGA